jgi:hypothetical protein
MTSHASGPFGFLDIIVLILAIGQVVDVWNNGSIFSKRRNVIADRVLFGQPTLLDRLLDCCYCLSFHAGWILVALVLFVPGGYGWVIVYWLAAVRGSLLLNGALPAGMRYVSDEPREVEELDNGLSPDDSTGQPASPVDVP